MAFDPAPVALMPLREESGRLVVRWTSTAPAGTWYQVYVGRRLAWYGQALRASLPTPEAKARIDVGAVLPAERATDLSGTLPGSPHQDRAALQWLGGTYLDPDGGDDVLGFRIYGEPSPGAGIDYGRPLDDLAAYGDEPTDGWGMGGWGQGGWGRAAASYRWSSPPLRNGTWAFAVRPYDAAGNEGPAMTASIAITAPPPPPPFDAARRARMWYEYDPATRVATLRWLPSED